MKLRDKGKPRQGRTSDFVEEVEGHEVHFVSFEVEVDGDGDGDGDERDPLRAFAYVDRGDQGLHILHRADARQHATWISLTGKTRKMRGLRRLLQQTEIPRFEFTDDELAGMVTGAFFPKIARRGDRVDQRY